MRIVVAGALANKPEYGGEAWVRMAWVMGLKRLGADVLFVEELDLEERNAVEPLAAPATPHVCFFRTVAADFGLLDASALITPRGDDIAGVPMAAALDFASHADLLVNISGHLRNPSLFAAVKRRAYIDLEPGYTQAWHAAGIGDLRLHAHDAHFSVGLNVGSEVCPVPLRGIRWTPVLPPVVLDEWPATDIPNPLRFSTVASWSGTHGRVTQGGRKRGLKLHEFRKVADLPRRTGLPMEIALEVQPEDHQERAVMHGRGWSIVDPREVASTPRSFREYIQASSAELSAAQSIYVGTTSGWFSDRSACYLAAGRPVVVQHTGFARKLPVGEGILPYRTVDGAEDAVRSVMLAPDRHGRAAREIAEAYFDSDKVLAEFLDRALPTRRPRSIARGRRDTVDSTSPKHHSR